LHVIRVLFFHQENSFQDHLLQMWRSRAEVAIGALRACGGTRLDGAPAPALATAPHPHSAVPIVVDGE
jgi:hypothetical protein